MTDRDGPLEGELLYELDLAVFTLERPGAGPMDLRLAERIALTAIAADLPRICRLIGHAMAVGQAPDREV